MTTFKWLRVCVCGCRNICVSLWPLLIPAAFSYSRTVISCRAEIEPIYESKHQKQTNDGENWAPSLYLAPHPPPRLSLHTNDCYQYFQSSFLQKLRVSFCQKSMASHCELWQIKSKSSSAHFSSHKVSFLCLSFIIRQPVCVCVFSFVPSVIFILFMHSFICARMYLCVTHLQMCVLISQYVWARIRTWINALLCVYVSVSVCTPVWLCECVCFCLSVTRQG